jgi:hypothetical protein
MASRYTIANRPDGPSPLISLSMLVASASTMHGVRDFWRPLSQAASSTVFGISTNVVAEGLWMSVWRSRQYFRCETHYGVVLCNIQNRSDCSSSTLSLAIRVASASTTLDIRDFVGPLPPLSHAASSTVFGLSTNVIAKGLWMTV